MLEEEQDLIFEDEEDWEEEDVEYEEEIEEPKQKQ